jgi:hypothetical protein
VRVRPVRSPRFRQSTRLLLHALLDLEVAAVGVDLHLRALLALEQRSLRGRVRGQGVRAWEDTKGREGGRVSDGRAGLRGEGVSPFNPASLRVGKRRRRRRRTAD